MTFHSDGPQAARARRLPGGSGRRVRTGRDSPDPVTPRRITCGVCKAACAPRDERPVIQMFLRDEESRSHAGESRRTSGAQPSQPPAFTISTGYLLSSALAPKGNPAYCSSESPGAIPLDIRRRGAASSAPSWSYPRGAVADRRGVVGPGGGAPARCGLGGPQSKLLITLFPPPPDDSPHAIAPRPKWVPVESASKESS